MTKKYDLDKFKDDDVDIEKFNEIISEIQKEIIENVTETLSKVESNKVAELMSNLRDTFNRFKK